MGRELFYSGFFDYVTWFQRLRKKVWNVANGLSDNVQLLSETKSGAGLSSLLRNVLVSSIFYYRKELGSGHSVEIEQSFGSISWPSSTLLSLISEPPQRILSSNVSFYGRNRTDGVGEMLGVDEKVGHRSSTSSQWLFSSYILEANRLTCVALFH